MRHKPLAFALAPLLGALTVISFPAEPTIATNVPALAGDNTLQTATTEAAIDTLASEDTAEALQIDEATITAIAHAATHEQKAIRHVPFFSQFKDIDDAAWRKVACGVASLAMIVEYHHPGSTDANQELQAGIEAGAYTDNGWSHSGLIGLANRHNLHGESVSLAHLGPTAALNALTEAVAQNPVMVSVHYTFEPTNPIPHLVVVTDITDGYVHYNDPAEPAGGGFITTERFLRAWKQRYLAFTPN